MNSMIIRLFHFLHYGFCRIPKEYRQQQFQMPLSANKIMELYKLSLFKNNEMVLPSIMGATSKKKIKARTIGKTARIISIQPSYGNMLFRMVSLHKPDLIIEMGTAFGISTAYMALAMPDVPVITMEGNNLFAEIARKQFAECKISNITLLNAPFEDILPHMKPNIDKRIFVFIDGNHTYAATLEYFDFFNSLSNQNLILVFDDINWSVEMVNAWKFIKRKATEYRAINLFRCGILIRGY